MLLKDGTKKAIDADDRGEDPPELPIWVDAAFKLQVAIPNSVLDEIEARHYEEIEKSYAEIQKENDLTQGRLNEDIDEMFNRH